MFSREWAWPPESGLLFLGMALRLDGPKRTRKRGKGQGQGQGHGHSTSRCFPDTRRKPDRPQRCRFCFTLFPPKFSPIFPNFPQSPFGLLLCVILFSLVYLVFVLQALGTQMGKSSSSRKKKRSKDSSQVLFLISLLNLFCEFVF